MQMTPTKALPKVPPKGGGSKGKEVQTLPEVIIDMDISCGYHNLGQFVNDLENNEIFLAVDELRITPRQDDYFNQDIGLKLKTYVK